MNDINEIGEIGELLVRTICYKSKRSRSAFDAIKDLTCEDQTIEVKTQARFYKYDAFTIKPSQLKKCESVDFLLFVEFSHDRSDNRIKIYHVIDQKQHFDIETRAGRRIGYSLDNMNLVTTLNWPLLACKLRDYSSSEYKTMFQVA